MADRQQIDYEARGKGIAEERAKSANARQEVMKHSQTQTSAAGLGALAARTRKRPPMPMLSDFGGDEKAHSAALTRWREMADGPEMAAQRRALSR